jgi:hypothetical protein
MASDRASYTPEDVLDLLHDVETNIREGGWHFAASVGTRSGQYDMAPVSPTGDIKYPRIRLPQHTSRVPLPPITGSREEWPPRHSNVSQTTSTGHPRRPRVRLPPYAPRIQALPVPDSRAGWSSLTGNIERTRAQISQHVESHSLPLSEEQSTLGSLRGQVTSTDDETLNFDLPEVRPEEILSEPTTCEQENPFNTAHISHAVDMELDREASSTLVGYGTAATPNATRNKRRRASDLWDDDNDDQHRHASKHVKLVSGTSTPVTPTRQGIVSNCFSEPAYQSGLLDWKDCEMGSSSLVPTSCHAKMESKPLEIHDHGLSPGDPSTLHLDRMEIDPPETPISSRHVSSTFEEVARGRSVEARKWKDRSLPLYGTPPRIVIDLRSPLSSTSDKAARCRSAEARKWKDRNLPSDSTFEEVPRYRNGTARKWVDRNLSSHNTSQNSGDLKSHETLIPSRGIDKDSGIPARPVGLSDLPDGLLDRIFTILLKSEDDEITLSTSWLMPFVNNIAGAPSVLQKQSKQLPTLKPASVLRSDLRKINASLEAIPENEWPRDPEKSQTGSLTRSLLTVSKSFHERAARIFYGSNTFSFTHQKTCWIHLESFLVTIGSKNATHIRHICIRAPIWYPGVRRDAIVGALFDAMAPVTRLAAFKVPSDDRLLSAIKTCADVLGESGNLKSLRIDVVYKDNALHFINGSQDSRYPILADELPHHEQRRNVGCRALKRWSSESFAPANKPALVSHSINPVTTLEVIRFEELLAPMITEAEHYGWVVDQRLRKPDRPGKNVFRRHHT